MSASRGSSVAAIFFGLVGLAFLATLLAAVVCFCVWQYRLVARARALRAGPDEGAGLTVAYWFIPFVNLLKPLHVFQSLSEGIGREPRPGLRLWWLCWVASSLVRWVRRAMANSAADGTLLVLDLLAASMTVVAAVQCVRLIGALERGKRITEAEARA